jgi:hypothetical protein
MIGTEFDMDALGTSLINAAGAALANNVSNLKLPLLESDDTEHLLKQLHAIIASVSSVVSAVKELENSKPSIEETGGFIEL